MSLSTIFQSVGALSWVEPVQSSEEKVSCSRSQHSASSEDWFKPGNPQSQIEHSTTEPLHYSVYSLYI